MKIIKLNEQHINDFFQMRYKLLKELDEIDTNNLKNFEIASKKYYLSEINKTLHCWGVIHNNSIVSIASICLFKRVPYFENLEGLEAYILNVYTEPEFRKQGLTSSLIFEIKEFAFEQNIKRLWLNSSSEAKKLYKKLGFFEKNNEMEIFIKI